jgi:formate hydrogenlyase subunit 3/multisubunit Na+/H+ antiporter MnhD subunit
MVLVVVARNAVLFLSAWESMALASFSLVMFDAARPGVRRAGWIYFVAAHLGTALLLAFFAVAAARAGSLDFDAIARVAPPPGALASALFVLALFGFGAKAGFLPLHVWLPEAHPAAPSHVSAVMSGVMVKMGIYGLLRALPWLGPPPPWWGWVLVAVGLSSGIIGVLYALAAHELKRLLAYHTVENLGIIALGLGVGLLGVSAGAPPIALLGFCGALLHVLNHGVFKSLLFLGAGAVQAAAHSTDLEHLGGLMRRMPRTGASFAVGSAAISGLPPLNGFASEFLIFVGAFTGAATLGPGFAVPMAAAAAGLALIGGLAAACFAKAAGAVFLGEPRSSAAAQAREAPRAMAAPQLVLAALCLALGLASPWVLQAIAPAAAGALALSSGLGAGPLASSMAALTSVVLVGAIVLALFGALWGARSLLLSRRLVATGPTWDCGYAAPTPRMQYTASSFAAPLTQYFDGALRTEVFDTPPAGPFPERASFATKAPDRYLERGFALAFLGGARALSSALRLQNGRVQFYVLYLVAALLALVAWEAL